MCSELMQTKKKESFARFLFLIVSFFWQVFYEFAAPIEYNLVAPYEGN